MDEPGANGSYRGVLLIYAVLVLEGTYARTAPLGAP